MRKPAVITVMFALGWQVLFAAPSVEAVGTRSESYTAKVYAVSLNVRNEPYAKAEVIGSLKNGELVTVSQEAHGWLQVRSGRVSGWAAGYYFKKVNGAVSVSSAGSSSEDGGKSIARSVRKAADTVAVTADTLRLRSGPGLKYRMVGGLKRGDQLSVREQSDDWLRVVAAGVGEGWVS
ncbi:SH3 domain-containing protein, partial [Paenibacillus darwinianus]